MIIKNNTHYHTVSTRVFNEVPEPTSFSFESSRRMGFQQRLYFEMLYCETVKGIAFFYTLTYNDVSIPKFYNKPCFSYKDIRLVTNGKLSKILKRKYHARLKYFCACETGDGKGVRGLGNNPHYHFIFFVEPELIDGNPSSEFICISPKDFELILRDVWQGDTSEFVDWRTCRFGHCQPGNNGGVITSTDAFSYVSKYCVKDTTQCEYENKLEQFLYQKLKSKDITNDVLYSHYKYLLETDSNITNKYDYYYTFHLDSFSKWRSNPTIKDPTLEHYFDTWQFFDHHLAICYDIILDYYYNIYLNNEVSKLMQDYRNNYSPKPRMSKSLGIYGLDFIKIQVGKPSLVIPTKSGYKVQYPCLYYIRHLFYATKICPVTGNVLYYLNDNGIKVKLDALDSQIDNKVNTVKECLSFCLYNNFFVDDKESLSTDEFKLEHPKIFKKLYDKDSNDLIRLYAIFKCVYQYRNYKLVTDWHITDLSSVKLDYKSFLSNSSYNLDYDENQIYYVCSHSSELFGALSHPVFSPYIIEFNYLDKLIDAVSSYYSHDRKSKFESKSNYQKRMKSFLFNQKS